MEQKVTEQQIVQMAQQEEAVLARQQKFLRQVAGVYKEAKQTIDALQEMKNDPEKMFMNLGSGVLIEVEAKNKSKCKRAFAENGYIEESVLATIKVLEKRKLNSEKQLQKIESDIAQSDARLNELVGILKQIEVEKRKQISISKK